MQKMDIHDCLIYLENRDVTNEEIMEKMGCNKTTIQRWWISNKSTPKYLAKMQKWCQESQPLSNLYVGLRPPERFYLEALENADILKGHETKKYRILRNNLNCPNHYDRGTPAGRSKAMMMKSPCHPAYPRPRPENEDILRICSEFHPEERVRNHFTSELLRLLGKADLSDDSLS